MKFVSVDICNRVYKPLVLKLRRLVAHKTDWNNFNDEEKQLVENNILAVQILHFLNNTPLYKVTKFNPNGEVENIEANTGEVEKAINKAKVNLNKIGG